jgi:hypothetical protein
MQLKYLKSCLLQLTSAGYDSSARWCDSLRAPGGAGDSLKAPGGFDWILWFRI